MIFGIGTDIVRIPRMADNLDRYFTNIDIFNITTAFTGDISGNGNNDIFTLEANVSGTVNGNAGNDTFNIRADGLTVTLTLSASVDFAGSIDGGETGTDEIIAGNRASNNWSITAIANTLAEISCGTTTTYVTITQINGGGVGADGTDSMQGPAGTGPVTWTLNSAGGASSTISYGASPLITFTNIQTLTGAADTSDTFNFTAMPENTGITTINGGSNVDTNTTDTVSVAGIIDGADGIDSVFIHVNNDQVVDIGNRTNANLNIYQVENITANENATRNEPIGDIDQIAVTTNWDIDGMNTSRLTDDVNTVRFTHFTDISGANGNVNDIFIVSGSGQVNT